MISIFKRFYRLLWTLVLKRYNVNVSSKVKFNQNTKFGGYNVIHNNTNIGNAELGEYTYIGSNCNLSNSKIGKFCSIGSNIKIITATHPISTFVSTHPVFFSTLKQCGVTFTSENLFNEHLSIESKSVIIGNDVWIGDNVIIKGGIKVGDGSIIAMGTVVTKDVPPYSIVGGVPARIIKYRFPEDQINFLLQFKWWDKSIDWLKINHHLFTDIETLIENEK